MNKLKNGFLEMGARIKEATTFEDCILVETHTPSYYIILPFRERFIKTRISKKKYLEYMRGDENGID